MRRRLAKRLAWAGILTFIVGGLTIVLSGPASASVCYTPGCGGVVRNAASRELWVTNCWQSGSLTYEGASPPCVQVASQYKYNAEWFVTQGHTSTDLGVYYYDVDAWQAVAGCVTRGYQGPYSFQYDRRGKSSLWLKISSATKDIVVTSIAC